MAKTSGRRAATPTEHTRLLYSLADDLPTASPLRTALLNVARELQRLTEIEQRADEAYRACGDASGISGVGILHILGRTEPIRVRQRRVDAPRALVVTRADA